MATEPPPNGGTVTARPSVHRWSTDDVAAAERLAFYSDALTAGLSPRCRMHLESPLVAGFSSTMEIADMRAFRLVRQRGSAHRVFRRTEDAEGASPRTFSLIVSLRSPWNVMHREPERLAAGDAILIDSELGADMRFAADYEVSHLKLSESWLRQWLPSPGALVGRRIAAESGWGRVLASFVGQLSPRLAEQSPLPLSLVMDHVGALLALLAAEVEAQPVRISAGGTDLHARILEVVRQRCTEHALTVAEVASALDVSPRTVHRVLARFDATFGNLLIVARTDVALRMLQSSLYRRLTISEIGQRAGFTDASHFSRTIRARCGQTPAQLLRMAGTRSGEDAT
jgi:AraC-like DNA-binding protein